MRSATTLRKPADAFKPDFITVPDVSTATTTSKCDSHFFGGVALQVTLLQSIHCFRFVSSTPGQPPSPRAGCRMWRLRNWCPPPQTLLQADHSVQSFRTQSRSHGWALHGRSCIVSAAGIPPCCASRTTLRCLVLVPPPHAREQRDHEVHRPIKPSMGQGRSLQERMVLRRGHPVSLPEGEKMTLRVMFCIPPAPHSFVQGPMTQSVTWQSPMKPPADIPPASSSERSFLVLHKVSVRSEICPSHCFTPSLTSFSTSKRPRRCSRRCVSRSLCSSMRLARFTPPSSCCRLRSLICAS
mmetsp:Transcript_115681/g.230600  ORF Transcript_115681/g.230600 Transcript_115681/m.230600 type:complete len:297 (+) Transcript_115681:472-1362(+)